MRYSRALAAIAVTAAPLMVGGPAAAASGSRSSIPFDCGTGR